MLEREVQRHAPGTRVAVRILPRGASAARTVDVTLVEQPWLAIVPVESLGEAVTAGQRAFRDAWLSSHVNR